MTDNTGTPSTPRTLPTREQIAPLPDDARMDAYYYGFERTGVGFIDAILSAVAIAGKGAHHTESWGSPWEGTTDYFRGHPGLPDGDDAVDLIQKAAQQAANAVLALIDKENTMPDDECICGPASVVSDGPNVDCSVHGERPDDTIRVPRALIERVYRVCGGSPTVQELHALLDLPKPPAPRLRVVQLGKEHHTYETIRHETAHVFVDLEAQPDVLTVIDEMVYEWARSSRSPSQTWGEFVDDLLARIHAVLGVAS